MLCGVATGAGAGAGAEAGAAVGSVTGVALDGVELESAEPADCKSVDVVSVPVVAESVEPVDEESDAVGSAGVEVLEEVESLEEVVESLEEEEVIESLEEVVESVGGEVAVESKLVEPVVVPSLGDAEPDVPELDGAVPVLEVAPLSEEVAEDDVSLVEVEAVGAGADPVSAAAGRAIAKAQAQRQAVSATSLAADNRSVQTPTFLLPANYTPRTLLRSPDVGSPTSFVLLVLTTSGGVLPLPSVAWLKY
jgi:hypothetical protein